MRFIRHTTYLWITQVLIMKFTHYQVEHPKDKRINFAKAIESAENFV